MKVTLQTLAAVCLLALAAFGQGANAYGSLTAASTDCTTANSCVTLQLPVNTSAVAVDLDGTFSGTQQFESQAAPGATWRAISVTPVASTTTVTSATAVGSWRVAVSGLNAIRVRTSAYTSGTAKVNISASPAAAGLGGGGSPPGGLDTQVQFNDSGAFGGDSGMTYVKSTDALTVVGSVASGSFATSGTNGGFFGVEGNGSALTPAVGSDLMWPDMVCHGFKVNLNNVAGGCVPSVDLPWTWTGTQTFAGVIASSFTSTAASSATTGILNGANTALLACWKNNANNADKCLTKTGAASGSVAADALDLSGFGAVNVPVGAVGTPGILFNGQTAGIFWQATWGISFASTASATDFTIDPGGQVQVPSGGSFRWSNNTTNAGSTGQALITSPAAATIQLGFTPATVPVAQTLQVQNASATNTDQIGGVWTRKGSLGTGAAVPAAINENTGAVLGTGTTVQTSILRTGLGWYKALTNNTVTTVSNITDANNTAAAVIVEYGIEIFDGTNVQYEVGMVSCGVNNKAGAFTQNTCTKFGNTQGMTSGTLTVTWTITAANPALLQVNSNSSLTTTTNRVYYNLKNLSNQAVTEQ